MQKVVLVAMLVGLPATGCDPQACTQIGCGAEFRVEFQRPAWTPGSYRVELEVDGDSLECIATLPLDCEAPPPCPGAPQLQLLLDGCALDPSQHRIAGLEFQGGSAPKSIAVRVLQDDALLGEGAYTPVYTESFPNGPDCGPACVQAESAALALD